MTGQFIHGWDMDNFLYAMLNIAKWEWANKPDGAPHNDPNDKGGFTKYGIAQNYHRDVNVAALTQADAYAIYKRDYWDKFRLGLISDKDVASSLLDTAVQHGNAGYLIQDAAISLGAQIARDGIVGPLTVAAINKLAPKTFMGKLYEIRKSYYETLAQSDPKNQTMLKGWLNRIAQFKYVAAGGGLVALLAIGVGLFFYFRRKRKSSESPD